jgi:hypothetical protein
MHLPSLPTVCRTVVVLAFLLALALAGRPGWPTAALGLVLVGVWLAPLLVRGQVSCAMASIVSQMPKRKNSAAAP